jgi:hypothetical protein
MMRELKDLFDPEHFLNPGKLLPEKRGTGDQGPDHPDPGARASATGPQGPGTVVHGSSSA